MNSARTPWQYRADLKINKEFSIKVGSKKTADIQVYLQIQNLLNTKNILAVYKATGNPDDDGYLSSAEAQTLISSQNDPNSFRDLYSIKNNNPNNYSRPRVIRLGLLLDF